MRKNSKTQKVHKGGLSRVRELIAEQFDGFGLSSSKVWVVMGLISIVLIFGGHSVESRYGLLIGFLLALSLNSIVFFYGDLRLNSLFDGEVLEGQDAWGLLEQTRALCGRVGLKPAPNVRLVESTTPLAFSVGLLPSRSTLFVSSALLQRLTQPELTAVLTHELVKLKTQRTASGTAAAALAGLLSHTAAGIDSLLLLRFLRRPHRWHLVAAVTSGPMTLLVSPFVAFLVRASLGRRGVLENDSETSAVTRDPMSFARALCKLDAYVKARPLQINLAEAHLFTVSPLAGLSFWKFVSAQPSVETRVRELTGHYPL